MRGGDGFFKGVEFTPVLGLAGEGLPPWGTKPSSQERTEFWRIRLPGIESARSVRHSRTWRAASN